MATNTPKLANLLLQGKFVESYILIEKDKDQIHRKSTSCDMYPIDICVLRMEQLDAKNPNIDEDLETWSKMATRLIQEGVQLWGNVTLKLMAIAKKHNLKDLELALLMADTRAYLINCSQQNLPISLKIEDLKRIITDFETMTFRLKDVLHHAHQLAKSEMNLSQLLQLLEGETNPTLQKEYLKTALLLAEKEEFGFREAGYKTLYILVTQLEKSSDFEIREIAAQIESLISGCLTNS